jgi:hypothetical protein
MYATTPLIVKSREPAVKHGLAISMDMSATG